MPRTSTSGSDEIERIQREMAQLRLSLHEDVTGAVENAQALIDWTGPVRAHPWISFALAMTAGYFVIPKPRGREEPRAAGEERDAESRVSRVLPTEPHPSRQAGLGSSLIGGLFNFVKPLAFNMVRNYAFQELERYIAQGLVGSPQPTEREPGNGQTSSQASWTDMANRRRDVGL